MIVPTFKRPVELARCLESLARLDYPSDAFEVLVVDDGSGAPPDDVVKRISGRMNVTLVSNAKNAGPGHARNTGASHASGDFLAFTDDDCAPAQDWLRTLAEHLVKDPDALIGGRIVNGLAENPYASASQLLIDYLYQYYHAPSGNTPNGVSGNARFFTSNNLAMAATAFIDAGGFDISFPRAAAEDRDFCDRWLHQGRPMRYAADVVVHHFHDLSLRSFCRQHVHYGYSALSYHALRAQRAQGRTTLEPLSFYVNLLRYPFLQPHGELPARARTALLLALSQGAYAAGFLRAHLERSLVTRARGPR